MRRSLAEEVGGSDQAAKRMAEQRLHQSENQDLPLLELLMHLKQDSVSGMDVVKLVPGLKLFVASLMIELVSFGFESDRTFIYVRRHIT